jgi:hypothetical protein
LQHIIHAARLYSVNIRYIDESGLEGLPGLAATGPTQDRDDVFFQLKVKIGNLCKGWIRFGGWQRPWWKRESKVGHFGDVGRRPER